MQNKLCQLLFLLLPAFGFSQTNATIVGKVVEETTQQPMAFVTLALHPSNDSAMVTGAMTDEEGLYKFANIAPGSYVVHISFIGFEGIVTPAFTVTQNSAPIDLGKIAIKAISNLLNAVEIKGEKSIYESSIDRKTYNVGKDLMSQSGSASEILDNVPSVSVDVDGGVSLRGSSNVTIFINGSPSLLMKKNRAAALQAIPANTIERIEIITNPSAKYKPDGAAGIINLVLKKNTKPGLNGVATINAGNDERYNGNLTLNYKPGKLNLFASYGIRQDERKRRSTDFRILYDSVGNEADHFERISSTYYRPLSHVAQFSADYAVNERHEIGISGSYFYLGFLRTDKAATVWRNANEQVASDFNRDLIDKEYEMEKELSAHYEHKFKKEDHALQFELTLADQFEQEDNHFTETYRTPAAATAFDNTLIRQGEKLTEASVEYTLPTGEDSELEAGYAGEFLKLDLDFFGEYFDNSQDAWIKDLQKSSRFLFKQHIHAIYGTYAQEIEDFGFLAGLRAEQTNITSELVTLNTLVPNNYFKIYPTLHLSYNLNEEQQLLLSYSKRINRPDGDELSPFPEYADPRNIEAGNPELKPEQVHSIELGYQLKSNQATFSPTLYYRYTYDAFTEISRYINDTVLLTTFENLSRQQSAGLELVLSTRIKKFMSLNLSGNAFYNEIDASNLGYSEKKSIVSWNTKAGMTFNLSKTTLLQLNANYRSAQLTPQGRYLPNFFLNVGFRQDVFKKKASILFTVSDVFNTLRWQSELDTPALYQKVTSRRKSQIFYLGLSLRFGRASKNKEADLNFDEKI